jgi:hypothetical protein
MTEKISPQKERQIRHQLEGIKQEIGFSLTTGSALRWWEAFERENIARPGLILKLAEELRDRRATISEFFLAYVYSDTDNIYNNLLFFDLARARFPRPHRLSADEFLALPGGIFPAEDRPYSRRIPSFVTNEWRDRLGAESVALLASENCRRSEDELLSVVHAAELKAGLREASPAASALWLDFRAEVWRRSVNDNHRLVLLDMLRHLSYRSITLGEIGNAYMATEFNWWGDICRYIERLRYEVGRKPLISQDFFGPDGTPVRFESIELH